ncbi:gluzincin family metallopeptidase [Tenacibaculum holothuriorum]|nr:aminopeptidase [Tenacibaculum holothuriorum]
MTVKLNDSLNSLNIQQKTVFYNKSDKKLTSIFLHDWANSYKDRNTPLSERFIDDYKKELYFSKEEERGFTSIKNLTVNFEQTSFQRLKNQSDIIEVLLNKPLLPKDSLVISATYTVKIPNAKFTNYGYSEIGYHLRYWYMAPAIFKSKWQLMSNLNMDDLYIDASNYNIKLITPKGYHVTSNLYQSELKQKSYNEFYLIGNKKADVILNINKKRDFKAIKTKNLLIKTDIFNEKIGYQPSTKIVQRELDFIESVLGKYPNIDILVDKATQSKNPIYGLNQLPKFLSPFPDEFLWDMTMLKALTKKYLDNTLLLNRRTDYWLIDGIQTYVMMEYAKKYYPNVKLLGKLSKVWGIRSFNFSKLNFNDKYPFVYQFSTRKFLDQPLTTRSDSLSNFNRKLVNKYKAGLGLRYLKGYLGDSILNNSIKEFFNKNKSKISSSSQFETILRKKTDKDLNWFFGDYIKTSKKIDYTIKKVKTKGDSIQFTIKNKRNITAPIALYGLNKKSISFKKWLKGIDSTKTFTIPKGNFNRLALNYENLYPEYNTLDNLKSLKNGIFNKPLQFRLIKDVEDPYYNQIYFQPEIRYNLYDGAIFVMKLHNRPIIARNLEINLTPSYATRSESLTGGFSILYNDFAKPKSKVYRTIYGVGGVYQHYNEDLAYTSFSPYVQIQFKRNSLRDVGAKNLTFSLSTINREIPVGQAKSDEDQYSILNISYFRNHRNIIRGTQYSLSTQLADKFGKLIADFRYRVLTGNDRRLELRAYAGAFIYNNTNSDFFSFGLDRANDYLFQLNYLGRSEDSGFFSQQFIMAEGGFKSKLPVRFANQYMVAFNSSIGLWRWMELYNDIAFVKNRNQNIYFAYENGIRLNFVPNILELYFPIYSNNGWEISQHAYPKKIRFVLTTNLTAIYNFIRRGFL